jgi:hypothetical protein
MKRTSGTLVISCNVKCPYCAEYFDLFEQEELTEDGYIFKALLPPDESWGKVDWGEIIQCPECKKEITIDLVEW